MASGPPWVGPEMPGVIKRLASGAAMGGFGQVAAALASLWAGRQLVNGLGQDLYAVLVLLVGVQGMLLMLLSSGGQNAILVLLAGDDEAALRRRSQGLAAWTVLAAGAALAAGWICSLGPVARLFWSRPLVQDLWMDAVPWAGFAWAMQILCQGLWAAQRARLRLLQAETQQALGQSAVILAGPLGLRMGMSVGSVVEYQAAAWLLLFIGGLIWERSSQGRLSLWPREDRAVFGEAWHLVGWSVLGMAGSAVFMYGDRFFSLQAGAHELTAYGLATSLTLRVPSALGLLGPLALPVLAASRRDPARAGQLQRDYMAINLLGASAACVPIAAGGAALLGAWMGAEVGPEVQAAAGRWIVLLALSSLFLGLSNALYTALIGLDGIVEGAWAAVAGAAVGITAGFVANRHGQPASAWMALSGEATTAVLRARMLERRAGTGPGFAWLGTLLPFVAAGAIGALLLRAAGFPRWLGPSLKGTLACFVVAGLACLALGTVAQHAVARRGGRLSLWSHLRGLLAR